MFHLKASSLQLPVLWGWHPTRVVAGVCVLRMEQSLPECVTGFEVDLLKTLLGFPQTGEIAFCCFLLSVGWSDFIFALHYTEHL